MVAYADLTAAATQKITDFIELFRTDGWRSACKVRSDSLSPDLEMLRSIQ
jgi:hypothetical protein